MAIAYRQSASAGWFGGSSNASTPTLASAALAGSVLVVVTRLYTSGSVSGPSGFNLLRTDSDGLVGSSGSRTFVWWKVAAGGETAAQMTSTIADCLGISIIAEYTGTHPTAPIDVSGASSGTGGATVTIPSVTSTYASSMLLTFAGVTDSVGGGSFTPPTSMTERVDVGDNANARWLELAELAIGAGATGSKTATFSITPSTTTNTGTAVVLRPPNTQPNAPTLTAPAAASTQNLNAGFTFTWSFSDPDTGDTQTAYAFRRRIGTGSYEWWNGSAWQTTEIYISSTAATVTFPSGVWPGLVTYSWSVATKDAGGPGTAGPYSAERTVVSSTPPTAPTLGNPTNGSYADLASGYTFTWAFNDPDSGDSQAAYALRRKVGAGSYGYWNGTDFSSATIVWNTSVSSAVAFAAAKWSNGTTYQWSVATQDTTGNQGPFATDATVTGATPPSVLINSPVTTVTDQMPNVVWTPTTPAGVQTAYQLRVFSAAQYGAAGFSPGTSTATYDSGVVSSAATSAAIGTALTNGTAYRVYVQVTQTGGATSGWATFAAFTVTLDAPALPLLSASYDAAFNRVALAVTGRDNLLTANQASLETDTTGWSANTNVTVSRSTARALNGAASLAFTSTAAGDMVASTSPGPAVTSGQVYTAVASVRAATAGRAVTVRLDWYTAAVSFISSSSGAASADNTAGWQQATVTAQAPATAAFASLVVTVAATGGASEVHYVDALGIFPDPTGNLVANSDFENGTTGWTATGTATISRDTSNAYTGLAALKVVSTTTFAGANYRTQPLTAGVAYTASVYVWAASTTSLRIVAFSDTHGNVGFTQQALAANTWTRLSVTFTPAFSELVNLSVDTGSTASSTFLVDAVQVVVGSTPTWLPPTTANLVTNPSVEVDASTFFGSNSTVARDTARAYIGSASMRATATGSSMGIYTSGMSGAVAGQVYTGSVYVYSLVAATFQATFDWTSAGTYLTTAFGPSVVVPANAWTRVPITAAAPAATTGANMQIYRQGAAAVGDQFWADAWQIEAGSVATPYVDGAQGPGYAWEAAENMLSASASSFEDGTTGGWAAVGAGSIANSAAQHQDGTKALLATLATGAADTTGASVTFPATTGTTYTVSAYLYLPAASVASVHLQLSGTPVTTVQTAAQTTTAAWTRHVLTFTATATGTVTISALNAATATAGQTFYVDAVQVEQKDHATAYAATGAANASTSRRQQPWTRGGLAGITTVTAERSIDGGITWTTVRASGTTIPAPSQLVTVYDYEATPASTAIYRAYSKAVI